MQKSKTHLTSFAAPPLGGFALSKQNETVGLLNQRRAKVSPKVRDANEPDFTDIDEAALLSSSNEVGLAVRCYPNPAQNNVTIDANFNEKAFITYQVYNALGKVALQGNYTNSKLHQINTENVSNGLYLIKVFENGKVVNSSKITIQH